MASGVQALGGSLTPFPRPKAQGVLVTQGAYRWVRHPIYTGLVLLLLGGGGLTGHGGRLGVAVGSLLFFSRKAVVEEGWLGSQFPDYAAYRQQVPARLVPGLW
jgi:protein-S-isoprenylcysteine O-methyltransferase Ste14